MPDEQRVRIKPGPVLGLAMLLTGMVFHSAHSQETVYIGGRSAGPAVQVDLSVLNRGAGIPVRRTRPGPPDILPHDPANAPQARAASSQPLAAPPPPAIPALTAARVAPAPPGLGMTPASRPAQSGAPAILVPAAPPKPIMPAKAAAIVTPPPPPVSAPPAARAPITAAKAIATLPPGLTPSRPPASAILFAPQAIELSPEAIAQLDALAAGLRPQERLQLKSHAAGSADDAGVRRIALKRALAARSHLLAGGMDSARIDVRALGPAGDGGPDDRLDVIVVAQ